jgi:putative flippase GtrA
MQFVKFIDAVLDLFLPKKTSPGIRQFLKYLVCGGFATISDMIVLFILSNVLHINHLVAAAFGFLVGVATNYTLNTLLVFQSQGKIKREFSLFALIGIGGLLWTELILWVLVDNLKIYLMLAKMVAVVLVLFWNFFMRKKFVFPTESNLETLEKGLE